MDGDDNVVHEKVIKFLIDAFHSIAADVKRT